MAQVEKNFENLSIDKNEDKKEKDFIECLSPFFLKYNVT